MPLCDEAVVKLERLRDKLTKFVSTKIRDPDITEDIVQLSIIKTWKQDNPPKNIEAFVMTAARNLIASHYRHQKIRQSKDGVGTIELCSEFTKRHQNSPDTLSDALISLDTVSRHLPIRHRDILADLIAGHKPEDIAATRGLGHSAAKMRVKRARFALTDTCVDLRENVIG
jgi:DNA-directed RNA polymerase specialized sigma24 family protein